MIKYHKIKTLYKRDEKTKKLDEYDYVDETIQYLAWHEWLWTEKVDGMNIQIHWDGHKANIYGRTENAQIPNPLMEKLTELFLGEENAQIFEQNFGEKEVIFFGEGYGPKIQSGDGYADKQDFILFDVYFPETDIWLNWYKLESVAKYFNLDVVPKIDSGSLEKAVQFVKGNHYTRIGKRELKMEGLVCRPLYELKNSRGERIIVKIKYKDFQ